MTLSEILSIAAMAVTVLGLIGGWFMIRPQTQQLDSSTAEKYQEIADKAAKTIQEMRKEIDEQQGKYEAGKKLLMARIATVEGEVIDLKAQLRQANERASRFEDWAKRLVYQVRSMGGIPVDLDPTKPLGTQ